MGTKTKEGAFEPEFPFPCKVIQATSGYSFPKSDGSSKRQLLVFGPIAELEVKTSLSAFKSQWTPKTKTVIFTVKLK